MRRDLFCRSPFFGRRSCSLQFINLDGGAMFKVFVRRDEKRELLPDQLARFERLRDTQTGPNNEGSTCQSIVRCARSATALVDMPAR
jgi:hypothetical protein